MVPLKCHSSARFRTSIQSGTGVVANCGRYCCKISQPSRPKHWSGAYLIIEQCLTDRLV